MRFHSKESGMKRGLRVWTLAIIGGLLALLMLAAVACDDEPQPTSSPELTYTRTLRRHLSQNQRMHHRHRARLR